MSEKGNWYSVVWSSHRGFDESGDPGRAEYHDPVEIDFYKFLFAFNLHSQSRQGYSALRQDYLPSWPFMHNVRYRRLHDLDYMV